ncbi:MAG: ATP-binding cassette domain-containing protein [Sphingomonadales bacterium]|nr:ATP-binding cassette domain-containing protein [Sphingomonadales bacterium]
MSIQVNHLSKRYGSQWAVNDLSFEIPTGEIVGFLGPNGAGKSTTMKILTGYIPASSGDAVVCGFNLNTDSLSVRKRVGYLPEHNPLYLDMYVTEYLQFSAGMAGVSQIKSAIEKAIDLTQLTPERNKKIGQLSKGYRQRVGLAQALIHDPEVLILDEPTSGLDPNQVVEMRNVIKNLGENKTVLLSTHIMQEVEAMCSRVILLNHGKIITDDTLEGLKQTSPNDSLETIFRNLTNSHVGSI